MRTSPDNGHDLLRLQGAGARLRATLTRCRTAVAMARRSARERRAAPPAGDADADSRFLKAKLFLVSERLDEADRALAQALGLASTLSEALERERAAVRAGNLLLREADHRIKGSLQGLASLLRLQAGRSRTPEGAQALRLCTARVEAVGKVHELLREGGGGGGPDGAARLDLGAYLHDVCRSLGEALGVAPGGGPGRGEILVEVEPAEVTASVAQALGLAVGELVANAFRHGFAPGCAPGTVWVQGAPDGAGGYRLTVADDGRGLPDGFVLGRGPGLGLRLVSLLAAQAGAGFEARGGRGARFALTLPLPEPGLRALGRAPRPRARHGDPAGAAGA